MTISAEIFKSINVFMMGIVSKLRNNWKKSVFGVCLLSYGVKYAIDYLETQDLLQQYCEEARSYGRQPVPVAVSPKKVTVILNPAAKGRKAKDLFEKYCGPILYLAGFKVSIVQTEHVGQARSYMDIMENTDAIVVAGGDGTVGEVITGLLRRIDGDEVAKKLPIAVLPLGKHNDVATALFYPFRHNQVKMMAEAALTVVRGTTRMVDVMKVDVLEEPNEHGDITPNKPVYAIGSLQWGAFKDADSRTEKYWYLGPLKRYATYFWSSFKNLTWDCDALVKYTLPCSGCSRCRVKKLVIEEKKVEGPRRWWQAFVPRGPIAPPKTGEEDVDYSKILNPQCGEWHHLPLKTVEFSATSPLVRTNLVKEDYTIPALRLYTGPSTISILDFISEGFQRVWSEQRFVLDNKDIFAQSFELHPKEEKEDVERWYSIDNDNYEVKNIRVTLLPEKIRLYCYS
ncbi:acylglycerol kinase, mitochondrial-like [Artemia franciscana]|uniref:acylglycerol kinase, mitochondrial-like n=1 Tax=Artemia franciscana TaxID=6661 RepID=UPI0032D9C547